MLQEPASAQSESSAPSASGASVAVEARERAPRCWPALLLLFFLAPLFGEVLSTSTRPLDLVHDPTRLFWTPALYGSGAILIRELVRRRGLGWPSLLTLGGAYGVFEEAMVVNTWFNPTATLGVLGTYGRVWGINTIWALELTVFHAVVSICLPIALVEAAFPRIAARPWLRRRGVVLFTVLISFIAVLGLLVWGFPKGDTSYPHPPVPQYFVGAALAVTLFVIGLRLAPPTPGRSNTRAAPTLRHVYWTALAAMFAFMFVLYIFSGLNVPAALTVATMTAIVVLMAVAVTRWSRRVGWSERHILSLAAGALTYWLIFSPVEELLRGDVIDGAVTALIAVGLTIWVRRLLRRIAQRDTTAPQAITLP